MTNPSEEIDRIREVYTQNYPADPQEPGYLWHPLNPVSVYYRQAQERALITLFSRKNLPLDRLNILDVGCGTGNFLRFMLGLGVPANSIHGIDLMPERIERCRAGLPQAVDLRTGDASELPYSSASFDLVSQFTVFSSILDSSLRQRVAAEMARVVRQMGYILWYDLRSGSSETIRGIHKREILQLFPGFTIISCRALHPPLASRIATRSIFLCNMFEHIPFVRKTHSLILLQKGQN